MINRYYICRRMFFRVLWPSLISSVALAVASMADALTVGNRMGESGLAAIAIVTPLYMIYNVIGLAFSSGGCVTHSHLTAAGRDGEAAEHFKILMLSVLALSAVILVLGSVLLGRIVDFLGANKEPELHRLCAEYARPLFLGAPFFLLNFLFYDFVRCDDGTRIATIGFSTGCVADVGLNVLFVLILDMGVAGSAWATVIAQGMSAAIISLHFFHDSGCLNVRSIRKAASDNVTAYRAARSLRLGFTTSSRYIFQFLFLLFSNRLLLRAGRIGLIDAEVYIAVFDVVMNVSYMVYGLYQAFSDTMQPLASTFAEEHDQDDLSYLIRLSLRIGLIIGTAGGLILTLLSIPVAQAFGLRAQESLSVAAKAIPLFCLSTPLAGVTIILTGYYQATGQALLASHATSFRTLIFLLPVTFAAGWFFPNEFWWLFLISEAGALCALLIAAWISGGKENRTAVPVYCATLLPNDHDLARVISGVEEFCREQNVPLKQATLIQLAVEELSVITIEKAFTGQPDEYIQITLFEEKNGDYVLHIRNSAPYFNPLDLRMERLNSDMQDELMESIGVMMVKKRAKALHYRNYQGFNVMTVRM